MTIYEIKQRVAETEPYFFDRKTMKFFGQTLRDFSVRRLPDGRYRISAPIRFEGKIIGTTARIFDPKTNELTHDEAAKKQGER